MPGTSMAKFVLLVVLLLFFAVALYNVDGVVRERKSYRDQVIAEVAAGSADRQQLLGPMLVTSGYERVVTAANDSTPARAGRARFTTVLLPESLTSESSADVEVRHRGIHKAQVFRSKHRVVAVFQVPANLDLDPEKLLGSASTRWVFGVSDPRGLRKPPVLRVEGQPVAAQPGSGQKWVPQGFSAGAVDLAGAAARRIRVELDLELVGTNRLAFVPIGGVTRIDLGSNWPHPSFDGAFLPDERRIGDQGFQARWELSRFATGIDDALARLRMGGGDPAGLADVGVTLIEPVDVYQKSERATKYGMLFVLLTFIAFFMFEVLKGLQLHPLQYGLAGSALALFFLLLVSLSEHVPFVAAYLIASAACVGLLTYYVSHILGARARGLAFGGLLAGLYAVLFVILSSIDYALLLGTTLLFAVLAIVMVMTRRVDWYRVAGPPSATPAPGSGPPQTR